MVDLVAKVFLHLIFGRQNMTSIGDFGFKKLPHFYEFCQACVNLVTMQSLDAAYYEKYSIW